MLLCLYLKSMYQSVMLLFFILCKRATSKTETEYFRKKVNGLIYSHKMVRKSTKNHCNEVIKKPRYSVLSRTHSDLDSDPFP